MNKKHIKIVNKDYKLKKKLGSLKERLEQDVDDGKILAKISLGCAITTIIHANIMCTITKLIHESKIK